MQEQVQKYFNNYFGGTLNESTDEEIMEAVYDLVALRDAVLEAVGDIFAPSGNEPAAGWTINKNIKSRNIMKGILSKTTRGRKLFNKHTKLKDKFAKKDPYAGREMKKDPYAGREMNENIR